MTSDEIAKRRLLAQWIAPVAAKTPSQVVSSLGAMQAQDLASALWAIGLRSRGSTVADVEKAIADRSVVRTWPMRGTLHLVSSDDVRWLLRLTAPRIIAASASRRRQLELDEATLTRSRKVLTRALRGRAPVTREDALSALESAGIVTSGQRGYHMLVHASMLGLTCLGPMRGKQQTFVLLDEWVPTSRELTREESLAEITRRFFMGHGPATIEDLIWWSGLKVTEAKAGLALVRHELAHDVMDAQTYWSSRESTTAPPDAPALHLLPGFDEYLLGYRDRTAVLDPRYAERVCPGGNGMFAPMIVVDGRIVGTWKRVVRQNTVKITASAFSARRRIDAKAFRRGAERFAAFWGVEVERPGR